MTSIIRPPRTYVIVPAPKPFSAKELIDLHGIKAVPEKRKQEARAVVAELKAKEKFRRRRR